MEPPCSEGVHYDARTVPALSLASVAADTPNATRSLSRLAACHELAAAVYAMGEDVTLRHVRTPISQVKNQA